MHTKTIGVNGLQIEYLTTGTPQTALTVIFIHGFPFNKTMWTRQLEVLPENITGIAYDIRGFGNSDAGTGFYSVDLFARDLVSFVAALGLKKVVACGISMGGYIALRAMEISPETFTGLVLCDTNSVTDTNQAKLARFAGIEKVQEVGREAYAEDFIQKIFAKSTFETRPEVVDRVRKMIVNTPVSVICSTLLALASRTDTSEMLPALQLPVIVIRGEEDQVIPAEQAERLAAAIPDAQFFSIPLSGHLPNLENSAGFNAVLLSFLELLIVEN